MNNILFAFWQWLKKTSEEYARQGLNQNKGEFEDDFPLFNELLAYAREIVDCNTLDSSAIEELVVIMGIDNECESILDYIEENASALQIEKIVEIGASHPQYHSRWQLAELLFRRKPLNYYEHLIKLSNDNHPYVRRRALNCIERLQNGL